MQTPNFPTSQISFTAEDHNPYLVRELETDSLCLEVIIRYPGKNDARSRASLKKKSLTKGSEKISTSPKKVIQKSKLQGKRHRSPVKEEEHDAVLNLLALAKGRRRIFPSHE